MEGGGLGDLSEAPPAPPAEPHLLSFYWSDSVTWGKQGHVGGAIQNNHITHIEL